jgi:hypothetical protein
MRPYLFSLARATDIYLLVGTSLTYRVPPPMSVAGGQADITTHLQS